MKAIATLLYSPDYLPGAIVLGHVLRQFSLPDTKLVILIDSDQFDAAQLRALRKIWDCLEETRILKSSLTHKLTVDLKRPELANTFTKIQLWKLPYETVLYLDADTLPIIGTENVTDLLRLQFPTDKIVAAPDSGFPDVFNSGVFMLHPNETDYNNLSQLVLSNNEGISFDGADQGLLNQYFNAEPDWVTRHLRAGNAPLSSSTTRDSNWIQIPFLYNTTPNAQYEYFPASNHFGSSISPADSEGQRTGFEQDGCHIQVGSVVSPYHSAGSVYGHVSFDHFSGAKDSSIKLIHFIGPVKPWKVNPSGIFKTWWDQWYEYSGGKSIHDAIYGDVAAGNVAAVRPPAPAKITPSELCNPENYQQFATNYISCANSWDATKDSPPLETPSSSDFSLGVKPVQNAWNALNSDPAKVKPAQSGNASSVVEGNHQDQVAERVFDDTCDYVPQHLLMLKKAEHEAAYEYEDILEDEHLDEEEDFDLELAETFEDDADESFFPKVFPWEYKDIIPPTRTWDTD